MFRMRQYGADISLCNSSILSTLNRCNTVIPAASAHDVYMSLFLLMTDVTCASRCEDDVVAVGVGGVDTSCCTVSMRCDRCCMVRLHESAVPFRGRGT